MGSTWIERSAIIATISFFCTNFIQIKEFRVQQSTGRSSVVPLLSQLLNCTLWLKYGFLVNNSTITTVNIVGMIIASVSLYFYYVYTQDKEMTEQKILMTVGFLDVILLYIALNYSQQVVYHLGFVTAFFSVVMFGSPLVAISQVIKTKSTNGLISFPMSFASMVVCSLWTSLGFLLDDKFIIVPNFLGGVLAVIQLLLVLLYRKSSGFLPLRNHVE